MTIATKIIQTLQMVEEDELKAVKLSVIKENGSYKAFIVMKASEDAQMTGFSGNGDNVAEALKALYANVVEQIDRMRDSQKP